MEVASRYTQFTLFTLFTLFSLFTLFTLFIQFKLPYTAQTVAFMPIYIIREG